MDRIPETDPRRLVARLAVAVIASDGRITAGEIDALQRLDRLGLGPLSPLAAEEIQSAARHPIDLAATCAGLSSASPEAAALIATALAGLAAADGSVSRRERETLETVAAYLGLPEEVAAHIFDAATAGKLSAPDAVQSEPQPRPEPTAMPPRMPGREAGSADLEAAYLLLGLGSGASRGDLDQAYLHLVDRYDPAKVASLGAEFAALAVRKLAQITAAFEAVGDSLEDGGKVHLRPPYAATAP